MLLFSSPRLHHRYISTLSRAIALLLIWRKKFFSTDRTQVRDNRSSATFLLWTPAPIPQGFQLGVSPGIEGTSGPASRNRIPRIIGRVPQIQVIRPNARWIITVMQNGSLTRRFTGEYPHHHPMGISFPKSLPVRRQEQPVTIRFTGSPGITAILPLPTIIRSGNDTAGTVHILNGWDSPQASSRMARDKVGSVRATTPNRTGNHWISKGHEHMLHHRSPERCTP